MEEDYAEYLAQKYGGGLGPTAGLEERLRDRTESYATTSVATREFRPPVRQAPRPGTAGPLRPTARQLSRNRAAKRAATDVTVYNHLSTMYHMNRRIYEMYAKAGLVQAEDRSGGSIMASRPGTACGAPTVAGVRRAMSPRSRSRSMPSSRPGTAPGASPAVYGQAEQWGQAVHLPPHARQVLPAEVAGTAEPTGAAGAAPGPAPPSYVKRHVANTAAALKSAILDEIVENRVYESGRLRALFRSYLKLNAGEAFFPTLMAVVEELRAELGVAP